MTTFTEHDWDAPVPYPRSIGPFDRPYTERERMLGGRSHITYKEVRSRLRSGWVPAVNAAGAIVWLNTNRQQVRERNRGVIQTATREGIGAAIAEADLSFAETFGVVSQEEHDRVLGQLTRATVNDRSGVHLHLTVGQFNALMKMVGHRHEHNGRRASEVHDRLWEVYADLHPEDGPDQ